MISDDPNAYYHKGLVEEKLKMHEQALKSFEKSLELNPNQENVLCKKTPLLALLGRI